VLGHSLPASENAAPAVASAALSLDEEAPYAVVR
jgi:hypothetical protein